MNDLILDDKQIEQFAFNIYGDIKEFINKNIEDFIKWYIESLNNYIVLLDREFIFKFEYQYEICKYENKLKEVMI